VSGWPADADKVYTQGQQDNFAALLIMDGVLHKI
jgi:hypothetical protein